MAAEVSRRRRDPVMARREIIEAAMAQLAASPHDLSVSSVMALTPLSRKTFYVHFATITDLVVNLVAPLRAELDDAMQAWASSDDDDLGAAAIERAAALFVTHADLLRSVWWSGTDDERIHVRAQLLSPLADLGATMLRRRRPDVSDEAAVDIGQALALMNVHQFLALGPSATTSKQDRAVRALTEVWRSVLAGADVE